MSKSINIKVKAFTLVEIIVVIAIVAILSAISFISYENYTLNARDSVKLMNIGNIKNKLELYYVKNLHYPSPDEIYSTGQINGIDFAYIGYVGDNLIKLLDIGGISESQTQSYIYATTYDFKKYQIAATLENKDSISYFSNTTYASSDSAIAKVEGNYKGIYYNYNPSGCKVFANAPSLISSSSGTVNLLDNNTYFSINKEQNTPYQINPNVPNNIYTGGIILQKYYNSNLDISLTGVTICGNISNTIFENYFSGQTLNNFGGQSNKEFLRDFVVDGDNSAQLITITDGTNLYSLPNIVNIFASGGNILTNNWHINGCNPDSMKTDTTTFVGGNQTISTALTLTGNTIYLAPAGIYNLNGVTSSNGYIATGGDCIGLIGAGTGLTVFSGAFTSGGIKGTDGIISVRSTGLDRKNIIISGLTVLNNKGATNRHNMGIYADDKTSNITLKDIEVYNSIGAGVQFDDSSNYHYISNIFVSGNGYNSIPGGLMISYNSSNNIIKNITSTGNYYGVLVDGNCNNNTFENITISNSQNYGLVIQSGASNNSFTGVITKNNLWQGLHINGSANNNNIAGINSYGNNRSGLRIDNSLNNILTNINSYNNTRGGLQLSNSASSNTFNNFEIYNNTGAGINSTIRIDSSSNYNQLNNVNIYSNKRMGLYMDSSIGNSFNNVNIFNNNINGTSRFGELELSSSKYNSFNNVNIFNNKSNGIHQAASYGNLYNNMNFFSNASSGDGIYFESTSTGNILNNINFYNNGASAIINYGASNKYYGLIKYFGNSAINDISPAFVQGTDSFLGFSNGTLTGTTDTMSCNWHINPNGVFNYGATCTDKGYTGSLSLPVTTYSFGSSIANQTQPARWNGSSFVLYGTGGIDYNVSKKVGQK